MVYCIKDIVFPGKAHFCFSRVNIDIYQLYRHFQHQQTAREFALHRSPLEGGFHAGHHGAVADIAPIDVKILHAAAGPAVLGRGDEAVNAVHSILIVHRNQVSTEFPAQYRIGCTTQISVTGGHILIFSFTDKFEADFGMAEGQTSHHV